MAKKGFVFSRLAVLIFVVFVIILAFFVFQKIDTVKGIILSFFE